MHSRPLPAVVSLPFTSRIYQQHILQRCFKLLYAKKCVIVLRKVITLIKVCFWKCVSNELFRVKRPISRTINLFTYGIEEHSFEMLFCMSLSFLLVVSVKFSCGNEDFIEMWNSFEQNVAFADMSHKNCTPTANRVDECLKCICNKFGTGWFCRSYLNPECKWSAYGGN